jgi:hypothetical protein
MSEPTDLADLIRTRIMTAPATGELATLVDLTDFTDAEVLIYRQNSLDAKVAKAISTLGGCAIVIEWTGFQVEDENSSRPDLGERYNIAVWSKPILDGGDRPAEQVLKSILQRLWHWVPVGAHSHGEAKPKNGGIVPHKNFLIYDCEVTIREQI